MFGNKLRSWMEAVRPRKKQHRKDKKCNALNMNATTSLSTENENSVHPRDTVKVDNMKIMSQRQSHLQHPNGGPNASRYSAANLSSPESAYSTGYSTDGTSPGAPPDYYMNMKSGNKCFSTTVENGHGSIVPQPQNIARNEVSQGRSKTTAVCSPHTPLPLEAQPARLNVTYEREHRNEALQVLNECRECPTNGAVPSNRLVEIIPPSSITSPRQRNRIRTNPWVPSATLSPGNSCLGLHGRSDMPKASVAKTVNNSPLSNRYLSPTMICSPVRRQEVRRSISSSSCSSLSENSVRWERNRLHSGSDEEDCTLNEMMGKYDESYVYEKETDILSDSDPTDCDTDIDTGQDGGDEDDPLEREFDFIDNGSYIELDSRDERNTGHCTYYSFEVQRKASRRKTTRRSKHNGEKRRTSSSSKKRQKHVERVNVPLDGSKSAGATPLSVRRVKHYTVSKLALEDCLRRRSNSISFSRDPLSTIDKRDKEADKKYKELIVEAEHILKNMKVNGLSPRRLPGPANKRVEMLRSTECAKPEFFVKNRLSDDLGNPQFPKFPSNNFSSPRFSPKRNHITNFINNNSPLLARREMNEPSTPIMRRKIDNFPIRKPKQSSHKNEVRRSPKYKKKFHRSKQNIPDSSDSEEELKYLGCPQSEPVRRKTYNSHGKSVAFNLNPESIYAKDFPNLQQQILENQEGRGSVDNLRQQVLLNTIANLKRSLEDQSASLKQVYRSSQNIRL